MPQQTPAAPREALSKPGAEPQPPRQELSPPTPNPTPKPMVKPMVKPALKPTPKPRCQVSPRAQTLPQPTPADAILQATGEETMSQARPRDQVSSRNLQSVGAFSRENARLTAKLTPPRDPRPPLHTPALPPRAIPEHAATGVKSPLDSFPENSPALGDDEAKMSPALPASPARNDASALSQAREEATPLEPSSLPTLPAPMASRPRAEARHRPARGKKPATGAIRPPESRPESFAAGKRSGGDAFALSLAASAAPQNHPPDSAASEQVASKSVVSEQSVSERAVSGRAVSERDDCELDVSQSVVSEQSVSERAVSKSFVSEPAALKPVAFKSEASLSPSDAPRTSASAPNSRAPKAKPAAAREGLARAEEPPEQSLKRLARRNATLWRILTALSLVLAPQALFLSFWFFALREEPTSRYFAVAADGRLWPADDLSEPSLNSQALLNWTAETILSVLGLNHARWRYDLMAHYGDFSAEAFASFAQDARSAARLQRLKDEKLTISATLAGPPVLVGQNRERGALSWIIQTPLALSYQSSKGTVGSERITALAVAQRVDRHRAPKGVIIRALSLAQTSENK